MKSISRYLVVLLLLLLLVTVNIAFAQSSAKKYPLIKLAFDKEDVTVLPDGNFSGKAIMLLDCIAHKVPFKYEIYSVDWVKAQYLFKMGNFNILPFVSKNDARDKYAVFSDPVFSENFVLVFSKVRNREENLATDIKKLVSLINRKNYKVAVKYGSAEHLYLTNLGIYNVIASNSLAEMTSLLLNGGVNLFVEVLDEVTRYEKAHNIEFTKRFLTKIPKGFYINKDFLNHYPDFLSKFNNSLRMCNRIK